MTAYLLIGQDKRLEELYEMLKEKGKQVMYVQEEQEIEALTRYPIEQGKKTVCVVGKIPQDIETALKEKGAVFFHMLTDKRCKSFNAVATAEGAIAHAIVMSPWNIEDSAVCIVGFGTCGSVLAEKCKALGAKTTVVVRRQEMAKAAAKAGHQVIWTEEFAEKAGTFRYLFNTVPAVLITDSVLKKLRKDVILIDIASNEGGVDYKAAAVRQIKAVQILRIPGRFAAKSSAKKLFEILLAQEESTALVEQE